MVTTIDVKDASGATVTLNAPVALGRAAAASSKAIVLSTEDKAALDGLAQPWAFEVAVSPVVTNGAYSPNDIVGGLVTFSNVARVADEPFILTGIEIVCKAAVVPSWMAIFVNTSLGSSTVTDNAAFSIAVADCLALLKNQPVTNLLDCGTPNMWSVDGLGITMAPEAGTRNIRALFVDAVGVTLTSTSDIQFRIRGIGAKS